MKNKHLQLNSNECGLNSIKNLLDLYQIEYSKIVLNYIDKGSNLASMEECLLKYFYKVSSIHVSIENIISLHHFEPIIVLLKKETITHFVVLYKIRHKKVYLLDSSYKHSYSLSIKEFKKIYSGIAIIAEYPKTRKIVKRKYIHLLLLPIIDFISSLFLLSTNLILKQVIDNNFKDLTLYVLIELIILLCFVIKISIYLKSYQQLNKDLIYPNLNHLFHLKKQYLKKHDIDELGYRLYDSFTLKSMILSLLFNVINNMILLVLIGVVLAVFNIKMMLFIIIFSILLILFSFLLLKVYQDTIESRRNEEYSFMFYYQNDITKDYETTLKKLIKLEEINYKTEKLGYIKEFLMLLASMILNAMLLFIYFEGSIKLSVGELIAIINISSLLLSPLTNLISFSFDFSNFSFLIQRIKEIKENNVN